MSESLQALYCLPVVLLWLGPLALFVLLAAYCGCAKLRDTLAPRNLPHSLQG